MTVKELMAELKKANPDAIVKLSIGNPKDSAFTDEIMRVTVNKASVEIDGWVASDNEEAYLPGYDD